MPLLAFNACLQGMQIHILLQHCFARQRERMHISDALSKRTLGAAGHSPESL